MTLDVELAHLSAAALYDSCTADEAAWLRRFALIPRWLRDGGQCSAALVAAAAGWSLPDTTRFLSRLQHAGLLDSGSGGYSLRPAFASLVVESALADANTSDCRRTHDNLTSAAYAGS